MKKFANNDHTIVFYQATEGDQKFSFLIEGNESLTDKLLRNVKTKRIKEKDIKYAVPALFKKITEIENLKEFEIWLNEGIPVDAPEVILNSPQQVRDWLFDFVYINRATGKIMSRGHIVYLDGKELSIDNFFSDEDFHSNEDWDSTLDL